MKNKILPFVLGAVAMYIFLVVGLNVSELKKTF